MDAILAKRLAATLVAAGLLSLPACSAKSQKSAEGKPEQVDVSTPLGSMHATSQANASDIGVAVYAGATPHKDSGDHSSANVNISTSLFGVKVAAAEYDTPDSPSKVLEFYRQQLKPYGPVLECKREGSGGSHRGGHGGDDAPVTCENGTADLNKVDQQGIELKVGTNSHQRIVEIEPSGKGSKFALVYLRLRGKEGDV